MSLTANRFYQAVVTHADTMLEFGRGSVDGEKCPLFAGVIDVKGRRPITALTAPPPGIRIGDFNWCGNNLMHDIPLLETLNALSTLAGDGRYSRAVDDVFAYYVKHCPYPGETGLFPWGEHMQWSFSDQRTLPCSFTDGLNHFLNHKYLIHDHLNFAPGWFWEAMWKHSPAAVVKFAKGLDRHIVNHDTFEHNRHGAVDADWHVEPYTGQGKDFARHAGFFIFDCLFAYARSGDRSLLDWSRRKLQWHLSRRLSNGIVGGPVRTAEQENEGQHDQLAINVILAAELLPAGSPERKEFADHARDLFDARGKQRTGTPVRLPTGEIDGQIWLTGYFRKPPIHLPAANSDNLMFELGGIQWYADCAVQCAHWLVKNLPEPPANLPVMARRFCVHLDTALTGYLISGDAALLAGAEKIADWALRDLARNGLIMGMSNLRIFGKDGGNTETHVDPWATPPTPGYYYSVTNTNNLVRGLLRLALVMERQKDILGIDVHRR